MKKLLRIIAILGCFLGLASLLRIQAQKRENIIKMAALQDQAGQVVEKVSSHDPQELQMALTIKLPTGETMMTLADQDNVKLKTGEIVDLQPNEDITARVDQQNQLIIQNDQGRVKKVKLVVPVEVTNPLLVAKLQLDLHVADSKETYTLPEIAVTAEKTKEAAEEKAEESTEDFVKEPAEDATQESVTKAPEKSTKKTTKETPKEVTPASDTTNDTKTTDKQPSNSPKEGSQQSPKTTTTSEQPATTKDDTDDKVAKTATTTKSKMAAAPTDALSGTNIDVHRAQIQVDSWSDSLIVAGSLPAKDNVNVLEKELGVNGIISGGYYGGTNFDNFEKHYHSSYMRKGDGTGTGDGEKAYAVAVDGQPTSNKADDILVYYQNVGAYTDSTTADNPTEPMGAIVKISNIEYHDKISGEPKDGKAFIDFSNNFYSGMVYNGIETLDIDVTFTTSDWKQALVFPPLDGNGDARSYFTFGSLNGNEDGAHEWAGSRLNLPGKLAPNATIAEHPNGWYEGTGMGVVDKEKYEADRKEGERPADWGDYLGSSDYERGAVSFPLVGRDQLFKLRSESGFTWQSFSSGYIMPLEQPAPQKTVHRDDELGLDKNNLDGVTIDRDNDSQDDLVYTVYQKTYSIPNESIAKPNEIIFRDKLPAGLTVKAGGFRLFNTDGKEMTPLTGNLEITPEGKITYKFSEKEIEELKFDGGHFAVQITAKIDDDFVGTLKNRASIEFNSGDDHRWRKRTNKVVTHFIRGSYEFQKVDGTTGKSLAGSTFIIQNADGQYLTFDVNNRQTGLVALKSRATRLQGDSDGNFKVAGLAKGTYKLIETKAPDGHVVGKPTEFTISGKAQTTPTQIENDPYSLPVTGGQGIFWFIVVGLILTLSSLAIWRTYPRGG
ncbi:SpaA isopeptide-forming pilin-related protein [Levilactobacillus tongjiangensis]|uniref:SpaA isopeptide-forming pilin-related protein n=1 Tax=Levilactobacillus tongjiangensis TaxID=2486023 RepID=A0ABW1SS28_9LACO|nr:SpaA isopeptide-forming pilin-related protein [Levilactobacillus tongjiangensis]